MSDSRATHTVPEVSIARLHVLRATYLLLVAGLGSMIWPLILTHPRAPEHLRGVTWSLLGALSLLAVLGIRYPLQMLPLLLFEFAWKVIWVGVSLDTARWGCRCGRRGNSTPPRERHGTPACWAWPSCRS